MFDLNDRTDNGTSNNAQSPTNAGRADDHSSTQVGKITQAMRKQTSSILRSTLGDHALHVARSVIGQPREMLAKENARYDSKTTARKISRMVELISTYYS